MFIIEGKVWSWFMPKPASDLVTAISNLNKRATRYYPEATERLKTLEKVKKVLDTPEKDDSFTALVKNFRRAENGALILDQLIDLTQKEIDLQASKSQTELVLEPEVEESEDEDDEDDEGLGF